MCVHSADLVFGSCGGGGRRGGCIVHEIGLCASIYIIQYIYMYTFTPKIRHRRVCVCVCCKQGGKRKLYSIYRYAHTNGSERVIPVQSRNYLKVWFDLSRAPNRITYSVHPEFWCFRQHLILSQRCPTVCILMYIIILYSLSVCNIM